MSKSPLNDRLLPLVADNHFAPIENLLRDKTISYVTGLGNAGDTLIHAGAKCLFRKINTRLVGKNESPDYLVWGGGGNLGTLWPNNHTARQKKLKWAIEKQIPFVIMPQTATNAHEAFPNNVTIFLRERVSKSIYPTGILAPDLSLAYDENVSFFTNTTPRFQTGIFLRTDRESSRQFSHNISLGDVAKVAKNYLDYFHISSLFCSVITDRLHFAISSLIIGRETVLLPNSYFKNKGIYDAWLKSLGCRWGYPSMAALIEKTQYNPNLIRSEYECLCRRSPFPPVRECG